jgi:hypothetical protein
MFSVLFLIRIHERVNGCQALGGYASHPTGQEGRKFRTIEWGGVRVSGYVGALV